MSEKFETELVTLSRFVMKQQQKQKHATGEFSQVLSAIQTASKAISSAVRRAGVANLYGMSGDSNSTGDAQQKLDVLSNQLFLNCLSHSYGVCIFVSEENESELYVPEYKRGKYVIMFDPLDGSSNIDCLASIGTIFCIFEKSDAPLDINQCLKPGRNIIAAGYVLYGSATLMVLAIKDVGVNGFTLDPNLGEFILTDKNMKIKEKGSIYSVNEGYQSFFDERLQKYIHSLKYPEKGKAPYSLRYGGSMVSDIHRTLKYGGIFMYPSTTTAPNGKLRLLYECNPMAFIMVTAGGKATTLKEDILDIVPSSLHQRVPIYMGSPRDIENLLSYFKS